jgi:hypothetical protein
MKIIAVRIGNKYGPEYEDYIESKLPDYDIEWIREPIREDIQLQWNKMYGMSLDIDEPICVIDIDILLVNNYHYLFEFPVEPGQFLGMPCWWVDGDSRYKMNGGFYKYYPKDCRYIYDEFMSNADHWQRHYIENGTTIGPVNGEQHFVYDHAIKRLSVRLLPNEWFTRWKSNYQDTDRSMEEWEYNITEQYRKLTGNQYINLGGWHPDLKLVHFTHAQNKPIINNSNS